MKSLWIGAGKLAYKFLRIVSDIATLKRTGVNAANDKTVPGAGLDEGNDVGACAIDVGNGLDTGVVVAEFAVGEWIEDGGKAVWIRVTGIEALRFAGTVVETCEGAQDAHTANSPNTGAILATARVRQVVVWRQDTTLLLLHTAREEMGNLRCLPGTRRCSTER